MDMGWIWCSCMGMKRRGFANRLANYVTVIKVFRLGENDPIDWIIRPYQDYCDMFLFDTVGVGYGGTGKKFNWDLLKPVGYR